MTRSQTSRTRLFVHVLALCALLFAGASLAPASAEAAPAKRIQWSGKQWFLSGADLPYIAWKCDFGCKGNGGVLSRKASINLRFKNLSRKGVKTIRWYLFPDNAWQISRGAGDAPAGVQTSKVYPDMDLAVQLAAKHDLYIVFVVFTDTQAIPATWMTDATQREQLADSLGPVFARYKNTKHVLGWDLFHEPERGIDAPGGPPLADVQATVQKLSSRVHARTNARVTLTSVGVDRLSDWVGLGLDFHSASWMSANGAGPACAGCRSLSDIAAAEGITKPVVISGTDGGTVSKASFRLRRLKQRGFAGALLWSIHRKSHPDIPGGATPGVPLEAPWRFIYDFADVGPRARILNPCIGPRASRYKCPDLKMSSPSNLFLGRRSGKTVLFSRNSLNSYGRGPAELYGRKVSTYTMRAVQKLWKVGGGKLTLGTGARLYFKAIPGQYRYWKWRGAARMELWQLDGAGNWKKRVRVGPKTVYCLRDLKRTRGSLAGSPRGMYYPGCSQNINARSRTLGTSVGWSDIYPATYHENWVNVHRLRGCYAYVHIADPDNVIYESNEDNNRSAVTVRLPYTGSNAGCPRAKNAPTVSAGSGY